MAQKSENGAKRKSPNLEEIKKNILNELLRITSGKPPVGENYHDALKKMIQQAYETVDGELPPAAKGKLLDEIYQNVTNYGPIEPYLNDPRISEIMVNGPNQIFIEREGNLIETGAKFDSDLHVRLVINHMLHPVGRFANYASPTVDSHLPDGSRVNVVIPPISQKGPCISIRKFLKDKFSIDDLLRLNSLTQQMAEFMQVCVKARLNIIVAGNTSSGKTTLLNILAASIPEKERIVTIEDSIELQLLQPHTVSLEARPPDYEGKHQITIRHLVRNSLRMRPDRIIVGEVRGSEALDMLQAMNTGHDGSMTTVHSNSPRDTISRLETMILMAGVDLPISAIRRQIASAINLIVYLNRFPDGSRRITEVTEVVGMEGEVITMTNLFKFEQSNVDQRGRVVGTFKSTGLRPMFAPRLEAMGYRLEAQLFRM